MRNKKAQGLSITTIILIILGVMVLVALILAFTIGWAGVKDWIVPSNNVQQIVDQCKIACASGKTAAFCTDTKTLKTEDKTFEKVTCEKLSLDYDKIQYGIEKCPGLC